MNHFLRTDRWLVAILLSIPLTAMAWVDTPGASATCERALRLPPDANAESRRIACDIPEKYQQDVTMAQVVGRLIRLHDVAAWLTTDALLEARAFEGMKGEGRGWLTQQDNDGVLVRYFTEQDGQLQAIAAAKLDTRSMKATDARKLSPTEPASERESRLMIAKAQALSTPDLMLCTQYPPNTVVFESSEDGRDEILVFVMSAWKSNHEAPLGGYHMFRFGPDGRTQLSHYSQTRGCLVADLDPKKSPDGFKPTGQMVSHVTSATPTMFHVFMSLQYRQPLMVSTVQNGLLWEVDEGKIRLITKDSDPSASSTQPPSDTSKNSTTP